MYFTASNSYLVLDDHTYSYYKIFKIATSFKDFNKALEQYSKTVNHTAVFYESFLRLSKPILTADNYRCVTLKEDLTHQNIFLKYSQRSIAISYDTLSSVDPIILKYKHLEVSAAVKPIKIILKKEDNLFYLENSQGLAWNWSGDKLHVFQGKFSFEILNALHNKKEQDWIGTFHASTIGDGKQAVMLVGNSGSGKSTLATLLMYAGYDLIADDMSAMLADNNHIAVLPAALSVKEKAFNTIAPLVDNFENLPKQYINSTKGQITYIPPLPLKHPDQLDYPCNNLVLVRYSQDPITTTLTEGAEQTILQELITESWLAHNAVHAQSFLNWLGTVKFYELRYHNNKEAIAAIGSLFKE
ncbi:hypothetical protein OAB88_05565 [Winogradskyella sp.]|nr:hypothetical protein [Winogradskyella sp.]